MVQSQVTPVLCIFILLILPILFFLFSHLRVCLKHVIFPAGIAAVFLIYFLRGNL